MSQYERYSTTSLDYDSTRVSVGVDTILDCLTRTGSSLSDQTVLEAGCGTGNYLHALRPQLGRLCGIDFSEGMLEQARAKLDDDIELTCGSILDMPFADGQFDGVICNQVIHHLDKGPCATDDPAAWKASGHPNIAQFMQEAYRVLRPGGALVLNATTPVQFRDGFWWANLIPAAIHRLSRRMPDLDSLKQIIVETGFSIEFITADLDGVLQGPSYLDPQGPLREAWRAGDSTWSLATDKELASAQQRVERMTLEGTMQAYVSEREKKRQEVGQSTFICGRK